MSIASVTEAAYEPASVATGPIRVQLVELVINSGSTSGTVTASRLKDIYHILVPGIKSHTAAPTFSSNIATLAFTVPAETAASLVVQDITYTAVANLGVAGNSITIQYADTVEAGSETVVVTGNAIVVNIDSTESTATQVMTAVTASAAAQALISNSLTGTGSNAQVTAAATPLASGVSGGCRCTAICIGRGNGAST